MAGKKNPIVEEIDSIESFFSKIKAFGSDKKILWFRGHASNKYTLQPSAFRDYDFDSAHEEFLMDKFKSRAVPFLTRLPDSKHGYWEWLFLMQHYKIPTRLLDWTESALVALAFAVIYRKHEDPKIKRTGAHVWCIDPIKLNAFYKNFYDEDGKSKPKPTIPNITEFKDESVFQRGADFSFDKPFAIYGPQNNSRIVGQKGVFTLFPMTAKDAFDEKVTKDFGIKLIIKNDSTVKKIAKELYQLGISESIIFPELDSVSTEINREFENLFPKKKKKK